MLFYISTLAVIIVSAIIWNRKRKIGYQELKMMLERQQVQDIDKRTTRNTNRCIRIRHDVWLDWDTLCPVAEPELDLLFSDIGVHYADTDEKIENPNDLIESLSDTLTSYSWTLEPILYEYFSVLQQGTKNKRDIPLKIDEIVRAMALDALMYTIFSKQDTNAVASLLESTKGEYSKSTVK
jgi:hypothetical protein